MTPRLRYRKDWDWEPSAQEMSHELDASTDTESTSVDRQESSHEEDTGQSWLSNAAIIASFTDDRLRSAFEYHRTMSRLLDAELRARNAGVRRRTALHSDGMFGTEDRRRTTRGSTRAKAQPTTAQAQVTLTAQQMLAALDALMKLKGGH